MKIAVTYENGEVFQHFGHTEQFKVYEVRDGVVTDTAILSADGRGHGALALLLGNAGADVLICGGIGAGAQVALSEAGISLYAGVHGDADEAVSALLEGKLAYDPEANCDHHGHHHHENGEDSCGDHGCGEHSCEGHSCH